MAELADEVTVRPVRAGDVAALWALRLEALRSHPEAFGSDFEEQSKDQAWAPTRVRDSIEGERWRVMVAEAGGELVGLAGAMRERGVKGCHGASVWGVYVRPAHRGRGVAERMIEALRAWCAAVGVRVMSLEVGTGNERAIACYTRCGFVSSGVRVEAIRVGDEYYDERIMYRRV